jgi:phosphoribosylaminoimidazolecarboxamide formyltransferase/IMP cyclohydrolase
MEAHDLVYIDLVVVNLYPFEQTVTRADAGFEKVIENIDIGGPTMLRSAAKNFQDVTVVTDPADYKTLLEEMDANDGAVTCEFNRALAQKVFTLTSFYDSLIADYLAEHVPAAPRFPTVRAFGYRKVQDLRYGENPHQAAAFYKEVRQDEPCATTAQQLHGKELSYNNYLDLDAAVELVKEFSAPTAIVIKHTNPCGAASADTLAEAYVRARATDPVSAFGSIVSLNRPVDKDTAELINETFVECVVAPCYCEEALEVLKSKKNIRIMRLEGLQAWCEDDERQPTGLYTRTIVGGLLVQDRDLLLVDDDNVRCVTEREPSEEELRALMFAWTCAKHVKSNAIVYARGTELVGVGAGQMSRVDSARLAAEKAEKELHGSVMASDAFFPFRDGIDAAAKAGITAVIEPGGSVRDEEVIAAANEHGMAMLFTGMRHFKH